MLYRVISTSNKSGTAANRETDGLEGALEVAQDLRRSIGWQEGAVVEIVDSDDVVIFRWMAAAPRKWERA